MAAAWMRKGLGGLAVQLRTHSAMLQTVVPRLQSRTMCSQPSNSQANASPVAMPEVLRRMVSMENACQREKNKLKIQEVRRPEY
jgi:hypothetical protein